MNHLIKLVAVISLLYLIPAEAGIGAPVKECVIFADEATDDSKKEGGEKTEGENGEEEEEPDCD